ncbi:oligosaccharide flippase family protein, partial [Alcanivoracaceae bacterium MT1]
MDDDLRGRALRGIGWIAAEKWGVRLVSLGVFIILTRTVAPEAFGLVSMTSVITTLLLVFVDAGFQKSLIQRQQITVEDTSTAFWSSLVIGTLIYA